MKWEYEITVVGLRDIKEIVKTLNAHGRNGWELITVGPKVGIIGSWNLLYFKRQLEK